MKSIAPAHQLKIVGKPGYDYSQYYSLKNKCIVQELSNTRSANTAHNGPGPGGQSDAPEFALSKYDAISIAWCRWPSDAVVDYQCVWYAVDNLRTLRLQLVFQDSCDGWADQRGTR